MAIRVAVGLLLTAVLAAQPLAAQGRGLVAGFTAFGKNKIQYREFDWHIYHSPHFDVYYYTAEEVLLQKVVSFAESAYDHLSREFDYQIQDPIPLIFYATHSAFEQNNIILNFIPEGVGAFATPVRNRMVLPVDLPDPKLYALMLHELTHIFEYHVLFQGNLGKAIANVPPQWVMEGLASYMAKDEEPWEKMFLRDAVVNDLVPSITQRGVQGYFAYRFGHAAFDFMEEHWGKDGFRDFLYELRNTIGARVDRAVERAFRMDPEDFDTDFRRWLRRRYLPELVETGEPSDFGRLFRIEGKEFSQELSASASPSGDLVAAFATVRGQIDVVLFDARRRRFLRNLTKGFSTDYQYIVSQFTTVGRSMGRDLAFSPDGNTIAAFAKREKGRSLLLIDVLRGGLRRTVDMEVEQQLSPAWSPDGRTIAFSGWKDGMVDIFLYDLESGAVENFTRDDVFDAAPIFAPDGRSIVLSSVVGGHAKLFRIDLERPGERVQLTTGEWNDTDPIYSSDGTEIYFTSDRGGVDNIYGLDVASGALTQHTDVVTGCFMPTALRQPDGSDRIVYTGFWRGQFGLFLLDPDEPVTPVATAAEEEAEAETEAVGEEEAEAETEAVGEEGQIDPLVGREARTPEELPRFEPPIEVTIDDSNKEKYGGFKLFLEDVQAFAGISDDQTLIGRTVLSFSDYLGDKRLIASLSSVESFQNFDILYADLSRRLQWSIYLFDDRDFFIGFDEFRGEFRRGRRIFRQTGAIAGISYPFSFYYRGEAGVGYMQREIDIPTLILDPETGDPATIFIPVEDDFPVVQGSLVGDTTVFAPWGPVSGRRWRLSTSYAPDLDDSGTLVANYTLDARQYIPVTQRMNFAIRLFGGISEGNRPDVFFFGGLDTVRGFDFRSLVGDRAFFANIEFRFPLIDLLATPVFRFGGIRGRLFLDVGGAWLDFRGEEFDFWDNETDRLADAVSSYGWGVTINFGGLDLNWDFAKQWDLKETLTDGYETSFWIGTTF